MGVPGWPESAFWTASIERTLIALMQRSSSDCPEADGDEGGADCGVAAVSVGSDIWRLCAAANGVFVRCHAQWDSRLEASSYACTLQGEPLTCFAHFAWHKIVTGRLPFERHICVS
jgi:hypothetical protein